jgi:tellurite resistance protein
MAAHRPRLVHLPACSPFRVAWWAASFPLAASAVAALRYAAVADSPVMDAIAQLILGIATFVIGLFAVQTLAGIARGRLRELS